MHIWIRPGQTPARAALSLGVAFFSFPDDRWCSEQMDWVLCASHESSIAVGGKRLVETIKHLWPDWNFWTSSPYL
jgi:hypothetical protein